MSAFDYTTSIYKKKFYCSMFYIFTSIHIWKTTELPKIYHILVTKYMTSVFENQSQSLMMHNLEL